MILSYYRNQAKQFGLVAATWLLWRVAWRRARVIASNRILSSTLECPCCGWRGARFFDYIEMGYTSRSEECPNCASHSRHRALFLWLRDQYQVQNKSGRALIFAAERSLEPLWNAAKNLKTYRIDLDQNRAVDVIADIARLPFASNIADLIWCHHVLEQVEDDRAALRELHRACADSGQLVVSVGMSGESVTREFGFSDKRLSGNRRCFGADFQNRLVDAGFLVTSMDYQLTESECRLYGISRQRFYVCRKSNSNILRPRIEAELNQFQSWPVDPSRVCRRVTDAVR